ncbi:uncharacterized protein LOC143039467 [Oratosquilla oratoria]|uniref:uncharacterized protein LOC143039467 n=1 Tax=Oratosquilla oratoria TaxID=337810 RepID=UPI003F76764B
MLDDGMESSGQVNSGDVPLGGGKGKVLLGKVVNDNTLKRKKKKNRNKGNEPSEAVEIEPKGEDSIEVCVGEGSSSAELKKKKKKGHIVKTENDNRDSELLCNTERTGNEDKQSENITNDSFCAPSSDSQTKKKKKKKKIVNANEDDAPESVDSGCVVDSSVESLETDWDQVGSVLKVEHQFMSRLLAWVPRPTEIDPDDVLAPTVTSDKKRKAVHFEEDDEEEDGKKWKKKKKAGEVAKEAKFKKQLREGHELVQNYEVLRNRWIEKLESLRVNRKKVPKNASEKREEMKLKKKLKKLEDRRKQKLKKVQRKEVEHTDGSKEAQGGKPKKPIYTNDGQLVFSKFDFSTSSKDKEGKKKKQDLNKLLSQALKEKEKVKQLVNEGDIGKANELKEKKAWKGALMRAQGEKVKDDPELLKKSLKKKEGKKKQSQKKWEERLANEEKKKSDLSQKKQTNVKARKSEKLKKKMKKMKKKGHIVPGF